MEINPFNDNYFMKEALKEAYKALHKDEVPVGCVIICENQIIARAHNFTQRLNDATAHAEMQAFTSAADFFSPLWMSTGIPLPSSETVIVPSGLISTFFKVKYFSNSSK